MKRTFQIDAIEAIYESIKDKNATELPVAYKNIIRFLNNKRLLSESNDILAKLEKLINKKEERIKVRISTTKPIQEAKRKILLEIIKKKYKAKEVEFIESIEQKIIGGMKIEIDDEVWDNTIGGKLKKLQGHLTS